MDAECIFVTQLSPGVFDQGRSAIRDPREARIGKRKQEARVENKNREAKSEKWELANSR